MLTPPWLSLDSPYVCHTVVKKEMVLSQGLLYFPNMSFPNQEIMCLKEEISMISSLRDFLPFWEKITTDQWVLYVIRNVYCLDLLLHSSRQLDLEHKTTLVL